ncbi:MAG: PE family protein [Mycobacterium pseudokansasii]|uniref:PE family protein n=1 Tax=Mycobacterium pseudokansasii TaxID=2341080 RepID=UPI0023F4E7C7|nr:PE family protein [Mycobacterium pseudokansasii]MBY0387542.1 PE family protein [Mycobacterium pseudokansasii]
MSFVFADAELLTAAATDLANIGSTINTASNTAASATTSVLPPALDEVSASIAALFGAHGQAYQQLSTQMALFHDQFVRTLNSGAAAYVGSEAGNVAGMLSGGPAGALLEQAGQARAALTADLACAELALNETLVAGETALGQAVAGVNGALGGVLNAGFNAANSLVYAGEQFVNTVAGVPVAPNLSASLLVGGSVQGGGQFGAGLATLIPTGRLLTGGFDSAIDRLAAQLSAALPPGIGGGPGVLSGLVATGGTLAAGLHSGYPGLLQAVVPGPVRAVLTGSPDSVLQHIAHAEVVLGSGIVNGELAFNHALVDGEMALQQAVFGTDAAFNGVVNNGFGIVNSLLGTGEQFVNTLLGAPVPDGFHSSLVVGGSVAGEAQLGGIAGAITQKLMLDANLIGLTGGVVTPALVALGVDPTPVQAVLGAPAGFVAQLEHGLVGFNANLIGAELALNHRLVTGEMGLERAVFGTNGALNGVIDRAFNMGNLALGTGEQLVNTVLGAPAPAGFYADLIIGGDGQVFSDGHVGGLLGAVQQKLMLDTQLVGLVLGGGPVDVSTGVETGGGGEIGSVGGEFGGGVETGGGGEVGGGTY